VPDLQTTKIDPATAGDYVEADIATWSEADYHRLLAELSPIFTAPRGTPEANRCEILANLVWAYEQVHYHEDKVPIVDGQRRIAAGLVAA
jgi:antitoxin component HigA of HigAB toxin-antitoxin module